MDIHERFLVKTKFRSISESGMRGNVERIEGGLIIKIEEGLFFGNTVMTKIMVYKY